MQRHERIRFFITEQCRQLDPTYRSYLFPKQLLVGDVALPLLEGSSLTFRVYAQKKISFRIRLRGDEKVNNGAMNIGIPLLQVESISVKDVSHKHQAAALVFLLKQSALNRLVELCHPLLDKVMESRDSRQRAKYLTVIMGMDPNLPQPNPVFCRVVVLANKFTFPFGTAKKILMKDLPIMWKESLEQQIERRNKTGVHHDREMMAEMDDEAWDWLMSFLKVKWDSCPTGGFWLTKDEPVPRPQNALKRRPWNLNPEREYINEQPDEKRVKIESAPSDSNPTSNQ